MSPSLGGNTQRRIRSTYRETEESLDSISARPPLAKVAALHLVSEDAHIARRNDSLPSEQVSTKTSQNYNFAKRCLDIIGAIVLAAVFFPLIVLIVGISFASGGAPIFRHRRVGQGGTYFDCLKFRTMVLNADEVLQNLLDSDSRIKEEWLRNHKLRDDPRITRLGRFLRRTSLDELPQLWNVFRGQMSLVGPRPVVPEELRRYGRNVASYLAARPGITGLWQVSGRNNIDYRRRVALDVCYVRSRSLILDLSILLRTIPVIFGSSGAY